MNHLYNQFILIGIVYITLSLSLLEIFPSIMSEVMDDINVCEDDNEIICMESNNNDISHRPFAAIFGERSLFRSYQQENLMNCNLEEIILDEDDEDNFINVGNEDDILLNENSINSILEFVQNTVFGNSAAEDLFRAGGFNYPALSEEQRKIVELRLLNKEARKEKKKARARIQGKIIYTKYTY